MVANRYDAILGRNNTSPERMSDAFANVKFARALLDQLESKLNRLPDDLEDDALEAMDDATRQVLRALENAVFLGHVGYDPWALRTVEWRCK